MLLEEAIDACILGSGLEFDVARVGSIILKNAGITYEEDTGRWKTPDGKYDAKLAQVKNAYKTLVMDAFLTRSIYWNNNAKDRFEGEYKCTVLSQICLRISCKAYLRRVITETQSFYHD